MTTVIERTGTASIYLADLAEALDAGVEPVILFAWGELSVEVISGRNSLWTVIRRAGRGGLALRSAFVPAEYSVRLVRTGIRGSVMRLTSRLGVHELKWSVEGIENLRLRVTTDFTPAADCLMPYQPRDLFPLGNGDDPLRAVGQVEAAQRGLNSGLVYLNMTEPAFGRVLYFQNLTALNPYFEATGTKPDGAVGGEWPELGYCLPTTRSGAPAKPLPAGKKTTLSDLFLAVIADPQVGETNSAKNFLQLLGTVYQGLELPETTYRDWIERSRRTLADLEHAPEATIRHYRKLYVHPYTASEYPDIMVQMSVMASVHSWGYWLGEPHPLEDKLKRGLSNFYDPRLKTMRRYLPNVGKDKDKDAVDSWYLYHPLLNLGRLALSGDKPSEVLFRKSLDYAVKAGRHFKYAWPIQFKVTDFSVITAAAGDGRGQTDVGGIYAYVMLQAYQLTSEPRFLAEARAAIDAVQGLRFNLNYQANLTAWGAAACVRLWRITNDERYRDESFVFLASFFHNCMIWESQIAGAKHFKNFLAVTCLQDAPYMAVYECFDSFAAFENYLADCGPDLEPAVRMLVSEYCKYALDRAWFFYPDALPADLIASKQRNGHIDRKLSFPMEDLYGDGQPAGQVGQEIYGCGAAFIFATRSHMNIEGAPFRLFCNHFIRASERIDAHTLSLQLDGGETCEAMLCVLRLDHHALPQVTVNSATGDQFRSRACTDEQINFAVPANGRVIVRWSGDS